MRDPNPKAAGGVEALTRAGVEVEVGLMAGKARVANEVWLIAMERRRPFVTLKAAITLDGKIARSDGSSKWITGEASRLAGHKLRAEMGAVLVGRRTIESDDPLLTARVRGVVNQPVRVVLDPSGRLLGRERVFGREAETLWLVDEHRATGSQVGVALQQGRFEVSDILEALWQRGIRGLLVEGGGQTLGTFLASGLVDRLCLFVAPKVFGRGICWAGSALDLPDDLNLELTTLRRVGVDFEANYLIRAKSTGTKCDPPSS
jgi:diaminohydroxyphosphoribosylaminopyrimidine deaminase/5-amino-6-(5-phosphoribosylamino)uracil reductase